MTKKQEAQARKALLDSMKSYVAAVTMWRNEAPEERKFIIPSNWELTSYLLHRLKMARIALRCSVRAVRRHNGEYHEHTSEELINLWEKML